MGGVTKGPADPIRVLLVDDHEHVVWGLTKLIDGEWPRMMVVGSTGNMTDARALVRECRPDIVVLDVYLQGENALDALPMLREDARAKVIVLTGSRDRGVRARALAQGAQSVVEKDAPAETLLREIERAHRRDDPPRPTR
jgi:two-component system, NarL family, nitrate/nitrite response regulator NarL